MTFQQPELRAYHREHDIATEAWSPLGQGRELDLPQIVAIAEAHGRTPAQVILRWHLQIGNIVFPKSVTPSGSARTSRCSTSSSPTRSSPRSRAWTGARIGPDPDRFG